MHIMGTYVNLIIDILVIMFNEVFKMYQQAYRNLTENT